jgi:glucose/arabinose dehydrogenase
VFFLMTVSRAGPGTGLLIVLALAFLTGAARAACAPDNGGITLPPGFCASVFADRIGQARHLAVAADGGTPRSNFEVFANGFAGVSAPGRIPSKRLALGPDGALYISDDQRGRIWKVVRR